MEKLVYIIVVFFLYLTYLMAFEMPEFMSDYKNIRHFCFIVHFVPYSISFSGLSKIFAIIYYIVFIYLVAKVINVIIKILRKDY